MRQYTLKYLFFLIVIGLSVPIIVYADDPVEIEPNEIETNEIEQGTDDYAAGLNAFTHLDYTTARQKLGVLAEQGNVDAMFFMGASYDPAYHILPSGKFYQTEFFDVALAVEWYEKAAASDHALALHHLGHMYLALQGADWLTRFPNPKIDATAYAITLYRRAEEQFRASIDEGDGVAAYMMAVERRDEQTFYSWLDQSRKLLEAQALQGDPIPQYYLGRSYMFRKPKGSSASSFVNDPVLAFAWFTVAARNGILHANIYQLEAAEAMRIRDHSRAEKVTKELLNKLKTASDGQ